DRCRPRGRPARRGVTPPRGVAPRAAKGAPKSPPPPQKPPPTPKGPRLPRLSTKGARRVRHCLPPATPLQCPPFAPGRRRGRLMVSQERFTVSTTGPRDMHDLTRRVAEVVARSEVRTGVAHIFHLGSTAAVGLIEFEPGLP